ncbi:DUF2723 domain-containing protein [bacterium]|nr:DUF2723 domain-containing protein [bacterium]
MVFFLYFSTLQPSITWYNSAELAVAGLTLNVPHAPGYPLFTRLSNLACKLPFGEEPAWRVNLLSGFLGALSAGLFSVWLNKWGRLPRIISLAASLWMVSFVTFWEEATNAEVYTLEVLLLVFLMIIGSWLSEGEVCGLKAFLCGLILTLAVGHRPTFFLLSIGAFFPIWRTGFFKRRRKRTFGYLFLGFLIGLSPHWDLYERLQNPDQFLIDPQMGAGLEGFWRFITAADFHKAFGGFSPTELLERFIGWASLIINDGGLALLMIPCLAFFSRRTKDDFQINTCVLVLIINTGFVLNYNAFEAHTMLLPTVLALCGLTAHGFVRLMGKRKNLCRFSFSVLVASSILTSSLKLSPRNRETEQFARRLVALVPKGETLLISNDVEFRPLWYLRIAHRFRQDLNIILIDSMAPEVLQKIRSKVASGGVFGSLIFPKNLRSDLEKEFLIQPLGYLSKITLPVFPHDFVSKSDPIISASLSNQAEILFYFEPKIVSMPDGNGKFSNLEHGKCRGGDVIEFSYWIKKAGLELKNLFVFTWIANSSGEPFTQNGVCLGYDFHFPFQEISGRKLLFSGFPDLIEFKRALVIPNELPRGNYEVKMLVGYCEKGILPGLITNRLDGINCLNYDGFLEVFLLKNGLNEKTLIHETKWKKINSENQYRINASVTIKLVSLEAQSN